MSLFSTPEVTSSSSGSASIELMSEEEIKARMEEIEKQRSQQLASTSIHTNTASAATNLTQNISIPIGVSSTQSEQARFDMTAVTVPPEVAQGTNWFNKLTGKAPKSTDTTASRGSETGHIVLSGKQQVEFAKIAGSGIDITAGIDDPNFDPEKALDDALGQFNANLGNIGELSGMDITNAANEIKRVAGGEQDNSIEISKASMSYFSQHGRELINQKGEFIETDDFKSQPPEVQNYIKSFYSKVKQ